MNHDIGWFFRKTLIECTLKNNSSKYPSPQNNPLLILCKEYRSPSQYQVKRKW